MAAQNLLTAMLFVCYATSIVALSRRILVRGVIVTPFLFGNGLLLLSISPAFFLATWFGFSRDAYPVIIFLCAFAAMLFGFALKIPLRVFPKPSKRSPDQISIINQAHRLAALALAGLLIALGLFFYEGLPVTVYALVGLLQGDVAGLVDETRQARLALTKGAYFDEEYRGQGFFRVVNGLGWSLLVAYYAALFSLRHSWRRASLLAAAIVLSWIFVAGTGERAPFLLSVLTGVIAYSLVRPIPVRAMLVLFPALLAVAILLGVYTNKMHGVLAGDQGFGVSTAVSTILHRSAVGNAGNDVRIINYVRDGTISPTVGQYHIRNAITSIPGVQYGMPLSYELTLIEGGGSTTFRSGTYISIVYADFGFPGVILIFGIIGIVIKSIHANIFPLPYLPWTLAIVALIIRNVYTLIMSGFTAVISGGVVILALLCFHAAATRLNMRIARRPGLQFAFRHTRRRPSRHAQALTTGRTGRLAWASASVVRATQRPPRW